VLLDDAADTARQQAAAAYGDVAAESSGSGSGTVKDFFAAQEASASSSSSSSSNRSAAQLFGAAPSSSSQSGQSSAPAPSAADLFTSSYLSSSRSSSSRSSPRQSDAQREALASDAEALYANLFSEPAGSYPRASAWAARPVRPEVVRRNNSKAAAAPGASLTPAEIESFREILNIPGRNGDEADAHADASFGASELDEDPQASAGFGSSLRRDSATSKLDAFVERNALRAPVATPQYGNTRGGYLVPSGWRGRQGIVQDAQAKKRAPAIGALREGIMLEQVGAEEMERTLEEARAQVAACESVAEVWEWARENVLRSPEEEESSASPPSADDPSSSTSPATSLPRYGLRTAFYAPVLLILLRELRERFHSPLSALSILEVASALGSLSLVQLTPMLYSEAINTRHSILSDLSGAYSSLQLARATGVAPAPSDATKIVVPRFSDAESAQRKDEETLRRAVEEVTNQVREASVFRRAQDSRSHKASTAGSGSGAADVRFRSEKARQDVRIADAMSSLAGYSRATSIVMEEGLGGPRRRERSSKKGI
jgi:hypothetical protein